MKQIKQLFWIFLFSLMGEIISALLSKYIAIPGSVIGMVLFFCALHFKWVKMEQVEEAGTWLTNNMGIFFVPAGVGLMANFDVLADTWWQLLVIMAITTALMMAFVGRIVQAIKSKEVEAETKIVAVPEENEVNADVV
ncbi:CidA/LrgA family protein [Vagococcus sp. JNUCC 83]